MLQLAGLTMATLWLTGDYAGGLATGPVLSFSPIVAGHLGLSVKLKNF